MRQLVMNRARKARSSRYGTESFPQDACCERTVEFLDHRIRSRSLPRRLRIAPRVQDAAILQGPLSTSE
jgi:hypothetical protein